MARKSKAARSRQRSNILLGSLALLLVISVMGATAWWWSQKRNTLDPKTLCPVDGPLGHNIFLVDKTDPLNLAQKAAFDLLVTDLVSNKTPPGYLLSIFVLGDDFVAQTKPLVELCNPGDGKGHNELTENIKQLNRQYKERFLNPIFLFAQSQFLCIPVALPSVPRILRLRFYRTSPPVLNTSSSLV